MKLLIASILLNVVWLAMAFIAFFAYWGWAVFTIMLIVSAVMYFLVYVEFFVPNPEEPRTW